MEQVMVTKKKVLIIEDSDPIRLSLQVVLESCGFDVYSSGNVFGARQLAEHHWEELDVTILDMSLQDLDDPQTTGADIGIEFRAKKNSYPPESLIYSGRREIDYYRLALRLGAASYLTKGAEDVSTVVRHVKVLALRRSLNGENPKVAAEVARIATQSKTQSDAISAFCQRVLKPEFESCLGAPFVILFTEGNKTQNCADNAGLPTGCNTFYHTLQALAHGKGNLTEPFVVEASELEEPKDKETALLHEKFDLAAFLTLSLFSNLRLTIGILQKGDNQKVPAPESGRALCLVLAQYLRTTLLESLIRLWSRWSESKAQVIRTNTAKLCLSVGREIRDSLSSADSERLELLADDLSDTGEILSQLENRSWHETIKTISIKEVVSKTWELIAQSEARPIFPNLDLQGDCLVEAQRNDLEVIFSRLLQWLTYRNMATPLEVDPWIRIKCETSAAGATVIFEDNSIRLHKKLRADMFAPFTQAISTPFSDIESGEPTPVTTEDETRQKSQLNRGRYLPLYLAKMLVEGRYNGVLEDHSDDIEEHSYGHRIVMHLPVRQKTDEGTSSSLLIDAAT
jgi:DNA-binding NarL/FixJ family response regulator